MRAVRGRFGLGRCAAVSIALAFACALLASSASAHAHKVRVQRIYMPAPPAPGTPESFHYHHTQRDLNQVGVIEVGLQDGHERAGARAGHVGGRGLLRAVRQVAGRTGRGWQVWSVERRENLLEDQSMLTKAKLGKASAEEVFNYYLGWIVNPAIEHHFNAVPESRVGFAREWGMNVAVEDLHVVIEAAKALGGKVVLGGHSLGGSVVTAYATWDFGGTPGADGLSGLVYDDGGSSPIPYPRKAEEELTTLSEKSPWLAFGGIPSPYLGLFSALGSTSRSSSPKKPRWPRASRCCHRTSCRKTKRAKCCP